MVFVFGYILSMWFIVLGRVALRSSSFITLPLVSWMVRSLSFSCSSFGQTLDDIYLTKSFERLNKKSPLWIRRTETDGEAAYAE